jgi:hypothetical protein
MEGGSIKETTVESGTYSLTSDWSLGTSDNGETWIPYANEEPVIDGGSTYYITIAANNFTMEGFTFQNMQQDTSSQLGYDLYLNAGSNYTIRWNTFLNCSGFCIFGDDVSTALIDSNTFDGQSPCAEHDTPGTAYGTVEFGYGGSNITVSHNLVENTAGAGIMFRSATAQSSVVASYNELEYVNNGGTCDYETGSPSHGYEDMGAIYVYDGGAGTTGVKVEYNLLYESSIGTAASGDSGTTTYPEDGLKCIYLDDSISGATIEGNILHACGRWGVMNHGGHGNTITNNIFDITSDPSDTLVEFYQYDGLGTDSNMDGNTFENNIIYTSEASADGYDGPWPDPYKSVNQLWQEACGGSPTCTNPPNAPTVNTNIYWSTIGSSYPPSAFGICDSCSPNIEETNAFNINPEFADPAENNYAVGNSAVATDIDWQALPTDLGPLADPFDSTPAAAIGGNVKVGRNVEIQ